MSGNCLTCCTITLIPKEILFALGSSVIPLGSPLLDCSNADTYKEGSRGKRTKLGFPKIDALKDH